MATLQITFVSEDAGYQNTLGWYNKRTGEAGIVFRNTNDDGPHPAITAGATATVNVDQSDIDSGNVGFFLIANGAEIYGTRPHSVLNGPLSFSTKDNGDGVIRDASGHKVTGEQGELIFTDKTLNKNDVDYTTDGSGRTAAAIAADQADGITGRIAFEDLVKHSDRDFNDLVIDVRVVNAGNRPPVVNDQAFSIAENSSAGALVGQVVASDPDAGQALSYAIVGGNANGAFAINAATGAVTVADASKLDFENPQFNSYALTVRVTDNGTGALTDTAVVSISVTNVNEAPVAVNDTLAVGAVEDVALVIPAANLLANDTDPDNGGSHSIVSVGGAVNGAVALNGNGDVVFTPAAGYSGPASFTYTMTDGAYTSTAAVSLSVAAVADQPSLVAADASNTGNGPIGLSISVASGDPDGSESIRIVVSGVPAGWTLSAGVLDADSGDYFLTPAQLSGLTITPPTDAVGSVTLTVKATATEASNGDAANSVSSLTVNVDQPASLHGQAIDGYIHGATVFADADLDGVLDAGEASATTDTNGAFVLVGGSGPLVMFGGTDVSTGQAFAGVLRAPEGSTVVTPLTTLVAALVDQGQTLAMATDNVAAAFGLDELRVGGNLINLLTFDPVATAVAGGVNGAAAVQVLAAGIQVQNAIAQIGALLEGAGATDAGAAVVSELAILVSSGSPVDLANAGTAEILINAAATASGAADISSVVADAATVVAAANTEVNQAAAGGSGVAVLENLAQIAVVAQGDAVAADLAQAGSANDPGTIATDYTGANLQTQVDSAPIGDVDGSELATPGNDVLIGTEGNDAIDGLAGNDLIIGLGGNDQLFGSEGKDTLRGDAGNDLLNGGILADFQSYAGFLDIDTADYSAAPGAVYVNLTTGIAQDGTGGTDMLIGIERVIGSAFGDVIIGSAAFSEFYVGGAGNDTIDGGLSYDRAEYTAATAGITVNMNANGPSSGTVIGDVSVGTDTLIGVEQVVGTAFADTYIATGYVSPSAPGGLNQTYNEFEGADGNDSITGNGNTRISFRTALEGVSVDLGAGVAVGGASVGTDTFTGVSSVRGSAFADTLTGSAGLAANGFFESFEGRGGDDVISGGGGFDLARYAYDGAATTGLVVNMAAGTVIGDPLVTGTDTLSSIESIQGSFLDDVYNAVGFSASSANAGSNGTFNEFEGMAGNDQITGNGNTRVSYISAREGVNVNIATGIAIGGASVGTDSFSGVIEIRGSNFDDTLIGSNNGTASTQIYEGRGGNDTISGGGGFDQARYINDFTTAGITVNMAAVNAFTGTVVGDAAIGTDTLINIASVRGTNFADSYVATGFNSVTALGTFNEFEGGGGNDLITGNGNTRVTYINAGASVSVNLGLGTANGAATGTDTLVNVFNVRGSNFDDMLIGSSANDTLEGRGGNDTIDGGAGGDTGQYSAASSGGSFVLSAAGVITASAGGQGVDTLTNVEIIRGTNFADVYDARLFAGDTRFEGAGGDDTVLGNGHTILHFFSSGAGVVVNLQTGIATGPAIGTDALSGVSFVVGSNSADTFIGSGNDEIFVGAAGNDQIDGAGGRDESQYDQATSAGSFAFNGAGVVTASAGGLGTDTLTNIESIVGTSFADTYNATAFAGANEFEGLGGNDSIVGNGITRINFFRATSGVTVDLQAGTASGAATGNDTLSGVNFVSATNFADTLIGSSGNEVFEGLDGDDTFIGSAGNDQLNGGLSGIDRVNYSGSSGGVTVDLAAGTAADGMGGSDTLISIENVTGSAFNDTLRGNSDNNQLQGGDGADTLRGGAGNDVLDGGIIADSQSYAGFIDSDTADYSTASGAVTVNLATGTASDGDGGIDTLIGIERVTGSAFNDVLIGSSTFAETFTGGAGNDTIDGGLFNDAANYSGATAGITVNMTALGASSGTVAGNASVGTDTLIGVEQVIGTNFDDTYVATGYLSPSAPGGVNSTFNEFTGGRGNDTITGNGGTRISYQGALEGVSVDLTAGLAIGGTSVGTDTIIGGVNQVRGSNSNDTLVGGLAVNNGFEGFEGRGGNDLLSGGSGFDRADYGFDGPVGVGITVNLAAGTVVGDPVLTGTDTLLSIEAIRGSFRADTYNAVGFSSSSTNAGSNGTFNEFEGMAGDDLITGNGNMRVSYSLAREAVNVNLATGIATGGASVGIDSFSGVNAARGSNFDDTLIGSNNDVSTLQVFEGRGGNDTINGGGGFDQSSYSSDPTTSGIVVDMAAINAFTGRVTGDAAIGTDTLIDVASVRGTNFDDVYIATGYSSTVTTLGTFNEFEGGGGNDSITGNGNTRITFVNAGAGVSVNLGAGTASGASTGSDSFTGVNAVRGSSFNDNLLGSGGNDTFEGRGGNDIIDGLGGFDLVRYERDPTGPGTFVFDAAGVVTATVTNQGVDTLSNIESIRATDFADVLDASAYSGGVQFDARGGDDALTGSGGNDVLLAGDGNDTLTGKGGDDALNGGAGTDTAVFSGLSTQYAMSGGGTVWTVSGPDGVDTLNSVEFVQFDDRTMAAGNAAPTGSVTIAGTAVQGQTLTVSDTLADADGLGAIAYQWKADGADIAGATGNGYLLSAGEVGKAITVSASYTDGRGTVESVGSAATAAVTPPGYQVGTPGDDVLVGTPGADTLDGLGGNDQLTGLGGNDRLIGGPGNDVLNGGIIADQQSYAGFTDTDTADYSTAAGAVNVNLATGIASDGDGGTDTLIGIERVIGSAFNDVLTGSGEFAERYVGGAGNDTIDGGLFNDRAEYAGATAGIAVNMAALSASSGTVIGDVSVGTDTLIQVEQLIGTDFDDSFVAVGYFSPSSPGGVSSNFNSFEGRAGNDTITGNGGTRIDYIGALEAVNVNLVAGVAMGGASVGTDNFTGVNQVVGSSFADTLTGGNAANNNFEGFDGRGGNDVISGGIGYDRADYGFDGPVSVGITVDLAAGIVVGDPVYNGTDTLSSIESIRGSFLGDVYNAVGFSGSSTNAGSLGTFNEFEGLAGNDQITGNGNTRASYSFAREAVTVNLGAGIATGGASVGTDTFISGVNAARGSNFDDTLIGSAGNDTLLGNFGNDVLLGGDGNDTLQGDDGNDAIDGGAGFDLAQYSAASGGGTFVVGPTGIITASAGGQGTDSLINIETVRGTNFNDLFDATSFAGFSQFEGGGGDDTILGSALGVMQIFYSSATAPVIVNFQTGTATGASTGNDTLVNVHRVFGSNFADTFVGSGGDDTFVGGGGNDVIDGAGGRDVVDYSGAFGPGTFTFSVTGAITATAAGQDTDTLTNVESVLGTNFADVYNATAFAGANEFEGMGGNDQIIGNSNTQLSFSLAREAVSVNLGAGTATGGVSVGMDTFTGVHAVLGSSFGDMLIGSTGADTLRGGAGNDILDGGILADFQSYAGFIDIDTADYSGALGPVNINLSTGLASDGLGGSDTLAGIERVIGGGGNDVITGSGGFSERYVGGAGNDTIEGGLFNDRAEYSGATGAISVVMTTVPNGSNGTVTGDASVGTDTLIGVEQVLGTNFADTYVATGYLSPSAPGGVMSNFNEFEGAGGNDTITGNGGTRLSYQSALEAVNVNLVTGVAIGGASVGTDTFSGVNQVWGSAFAETLIGGLAANNGFESFAGRGGNDLISGGAGFDRADYAFDGAVSTGITVNMAAGTVTGDLVLTGTDTLLSIESVRGSFLNDTYNAVGFSNLSANAGSSGTFNEFEGMAGNDQITGNGNTRVSYASAREAVTVDLAAGTATGGASVGTDTIIGGVNAVRGSNFNDTLLGLTGPADSLIGGAGNDVLNGGVVADFLTAVGFTDLDNADYSLATGPVTVNLATGTASDGDGGTDTLIGIERVTGSVFNDVLTGSAAFSEFFVGGAGNDTIDGGLFNDRAEYSGATGAISVVMTTVPNGSNGTVTGDASVGTDALIGVEQVIGSNFADTYVATGYLSPSAAGGVNSNFNEFQGLGGNDTITGNGGTRISYQNALEAVDVNLVTGVALGGASVGTDTFTGVNAVRGSNFDDTLTGGLVANNGFEAFEGRGGNDLISGGGGFDRAGYAFDGAVSTGITVNLAAGTVSGDPILTGTDTLSSIEAIQGSFLGDVYNAVGFSNLSTNAGSNGTFNEFEGMAGNDLITGNGNTRVSYASAREAVSVDLGAGTATGGASVGSDSFTGVNAARGSNFDDTLLGSSGNDSLLGNFGNDALNGGAGNDFLQGDDGNDTLVGGLGSDTIVANGIGSDRIDFNDIGEAGDSIQQFTSEAGGDVLDIADLLDVSTSYADGGGGVLADFVRLTPSGSNGLLQIDTDGLGGGATWQTLATIVGGSVLDLNTLLIAGNIDVIS